MTSTSFAVSRRTCLKAPTLSSAFHGGMCDAMSSARIDSAHGYASSYVISDIGATPPSTWHGVHFSRTIGNTSSLYVYLDVTALCAWPTRVESAMAPPTRSSVAAMRSASLRSARLSAERVFIVLEMRTE